MRSTALLSVLAIQILSPGPPLDLDHCKRSLFCLRLLSPWTSPGLVGGSWLLSRVYCLIFRLPLRYLDGLVQKKTHIFTICWQQKPYSACTLPCRAHTHTKSFFKVTKASRATSAKIFLTHPALIDLPLLWITTTQILHYLIELSWTLIGAAPVVVLVRTLSQAELPRLWYSLRHPAPCSVWKYRPHAELLTRSWFFVRHSLYVSKVASGPVDLFWRTCEWLHMVSGEKKQKNKSN